MKHNVLALDIATNTGFANHEISGSINLQKGITSNRFYNLYWFLQDLHWAYEFDTIAVERVAGLHKNALIVLAMLRGVVELFAFNNDINIIDYSAGTIKKFYTGKGNAKKDAMMAEFHNRMNREAINDNEADAHAIYLLHQSI